MAETPREIEPLYPHTPLEGFVNGCLMDLRVRLALNFLQHSPRYAPYAGPDGAQGVIAPRDAAADALEIASELLKIAGERGLIDALPTTDELSPALTAQAGRLGRFQVQQQLTAQRHGQEAQARVVPLAPGAPRFNS